MYIFIYLSECGQKRGERHEQALVCLSNREIPDVSRG